MFGLALSLVPKVSEKAENTAEPRIIRIERFERCIDFGPSDVRIPPGPNRYPPPSLSFLVFSSTTSFLLSCSFTVHIHLSFLSINSFSVVALPIPFRSPPDTNDDRSTPTYVNSLRISLDSRVDDYGYG